MSKLEELFDSVLTLVVRFPATLFRLLFRPREAFDPSKNCSPGAFFFIVILSFYLFVQVRQADTDGDLPKWFDKDLALAIAMTYVAILVTLQRVILRRVFAIPTSADEQARVLFYPVSVLLLALLPIIVLDRMAPEGAMVVVGVGHLAYVWILYSVCRVAFDLSWKKSVVGALIGYLAVVLIPAIISIGYALWLSRTAP